MSISKRIKSIIDHYDISVRSFEKSIGASNNSIQTTIKRNADIKSATINKILQVYPDINPDWLLTGTGDMLKSEQKAEPVTVFKQRTDRVIDRQEIPLYDIEATAGLVELLANGKTVPIDTIKIPNMPKADGAIFVTGDSMYPLLKSGDIVIYKKINDIPGDIFWGEMYIVSVEISGEEYVTVKYVQKSELGDQYVKLVSLNQHHQPKDIELSKVRALALVKASIRFNTMN